MSFRRACDVNRVLPSKFGRRVFGWGVLTTCLLGSELKNVLLVGVASPAELLNKLFIEFVEISIMQVSITIVVAVIPINSVGILLQNVT